MSSTVIKVAVSPGLNSISIHPGARIMCVLQQGATSNLFYVQKKYTPDSSDPLTTRRIQVVTTGDVTLRTGDELGCYICSFVDSGGTERHVFEEV